MPRGLFGQGRDKAGRNPVVDQFAHESECRAVVRGLQGHTAPLDDLPAMAPQVFEHVAHEPLVLLPLPHEAVKAGLFGPATYYFFSVRSLPCSPSTISITSGPFGQLPFEGE